MDAMRFGFRLVSTTALVLLAAITGAPMVVGAPPTPSAATQISEIPDKFVMPEAQNDYLKRIEMIPMRDGLRLYTVIIVPKGAKDSPTTVSDGVGVVLAVGPGANGISVGQRVITTILPKWISVFGRQPPRRLCWIPLPRFEFRFCPLNGSVATVFEGQL
jgi:hypothetical protein